MGLGDAKKRGQQTPKSRGVHAWPPQRKREREGQKAGGEPSQSVLNP